jgi:hypothetical protein
MDPKITVLKGQIYIQVKVLGYTPHYSFPLNASLDTLVAQVYTGFMKRLGLKSHKVEVFPITPKKEDLLANPTKFYLVETPLPIFSFEKKTEKIVQEDAILAPNAWLEYNDLPNPTEAILKGMLFSDMSGIKI